MTKRWSSTPWSRSSLNCVTTAVRKSRSASAWAWTSSNFDLLSLTAAASAGIAIGARTGPTFGILVRNFTATAAPGPVRSAASASAWSTSPPRTLSGMSNLPAYWASLSNGSMVATGRMRSTPTRSVTSILPGSNLAEDSSMKSSPKDSASGT